jgi:hypothetical protein
MPPTHFQFHTNGREHNLCNKPGKYRTDNAPNVTCGWCKKELSIRGWYPGFKTHFATNGEVTCGCTTTAKARRRKIITSDPAKVTCKNCRHKMKKNKLVASVQRTIWDIIGSDDVFVEEG